MIGNALIAGVHPQNLPESAKKGKAMPQCPATDYLDQFRELKPSKACEDFIKDWEKCAKLRSDGRYEAYLPTPRDRWTVGWGSTGTDIGPGTVWTREQCDARFAAHLEIFAEGVRKALGGAPTTQGQFDALVSFAYNVGLDDDADNIAEGLGDSTLLRKHKAGDHAGAAAEFAKWNKQKGRVLNGLTRRRRAERNMYLGEFA